MKPKSHARVLAKRNSALGGWRFGNIGSTRQVKGLLSLVVGGACALWSGGLGSVVQSGGSQNGRSSSQVLLEQLGANLSGRRGAAEGEVGDARNLRLLPKKSFFSAKPAPLIVVSSSEELRPVEGIGPPGQQSPGLQLRGNVQGSIQLIPNWDTSQHAAFLLPNYVPGSSETLLVRTDFVPTEQAVR